MTDSLKLALIGVVAAIAITTAMDASGLSVFSALPLFPLAGLLWYLQRFPLRSMGLSWGRWRDYGLAALYPLVVLGAAAGIAAATGAVDTTHANGSKTLLKVGLVSLSTFLVVILTEEGFFRGWLWAALERAGASPKRTLIWTSLSFSLWHLSAVSLNTGFDLPAAQIPVFMVNAAVMGLVLGLLRRNSGSLIVASLSHGIWNGIDYPLFGFGTKVGALGIANTAIYGPEVGVLGIGLNVLFCFFLWRISRARLADGG